MPINWKRIARSILAVYWGLIKDYAGGFLKMETRKYRKVMLSVWGIINISIIICFIFEFFNTERYLMAEMYLKYFLLPLYLSFPLGTAAIFITIIMLNFLFPNLSNFTGTNLILLLICYSVATVAFYFQWIYLLPKFFFKKNKQ